MTLLQFIATLVGGLGIGSLITALVTKWLEARVERTRWLRDRRHAAYSALAKELLSMSVWSGSTNPTTAAGLAAEAILLMDNATLADRITEYFDEVQTAFARVQSFAGDMKEYQHRSSVEYDKLKREAREIVDLLRNRVLER
jgi:hypothetical protein